MIIKNLCEYDQTRLVEVLKSNGFKIESRKNFAVKGDVIIYENEEY